MGVISDSLNVLRYNKKYKEITGSTGNYRTGTLWPMWPMHTDKDNNSDGGPVFGN